MEVTAYCLECRAKRKMKDAKTMTLIVVNYNKVNGMQVIYRR